METYGMVYGSTLAKIGVIAAVFLGVVNMITLKEPWILAASMAILIPLTIYIVKKKKTFQTKK